MVSLRFVVMRVLSQRWLLSAWEAFYYSFPMQLFLLHFQKNQLLLAVWLFLALCFLQLIGNSLGIPYLFLNPEYLDRTNFWSFFLLGSAFGVFTAVYQMTCYILYSNRFAFLGLLQRPFLKFSVNNSLLPIIFHTLFFVRISRFQSQSGATHLLLSNVVGYLLGLFVLLLLMYTYLHFTHVDIPNYFTKGVDRRLRRLRVGRGQAMRRLEEARLRKYSLRAFLDEKLRIHFLSRKPSHYDKQKAIEIFNQNHFNALFLGLLLVLSLVLSGVFRESPYVQLPAAASLLLLFSILLLLLGAMSYWFRGWSLLIFVLLVLGLDFLVSHKHLHTWHHASGLSYDSLLVEYTEKRVRDFSTQSRQIADRDSTRRILERWRRYYPSDSPPKLVIVAASGGGLRAMLWTMRSLQAADSLLEGELMKHTVLITGASGGMISAAYYRELYLQQQYKKTSLPLWDDSYLQACAKDLLNPVVFSLLVNDIFFQPYRFTYQNREYVYDRGRAFEERISANSAHILNKSLQQYRSEERSARIPMLLLSATLVNDGRRLYISPQGVSYMTRSRFAPEQPLAPGEQSRILGIDFVPFFSSCNSSRLSFLSALRMNATFPYILPLVQLPSNPPIHVMDAGIFDNYGVVDALKFVQVFQDWLQLNTSGVILLAIRDHHTGHRVFSMDKLSLLQKITAPAEGIYINFANMQDLRNHSSLTQVQQALKVPFHSLQLTYAPDSAGYEDPHKASLSWHLTHNEKTSIINNIQKAHNSVVLERLQQLLSPQQKAQPIRP